jgi:hypothetical protein
MSLQGGYQAARRPSSPFLGALHCGAERGMEVAPHLGADGVIDAGVLVERGSETELPQPPWEKPVTVGGAAGYRSSGN